YAWEEYKKKAQKEFTDNLVPLMITTKSFGMGIDKPNIRYTIHYNMPGSIESYYQEAGRAGRDQREAYCALIFSDDNHQDSENRLNPQHTADEIWQMPEPNVHSDIHRMLFFQKQAFQGKNAELQNITNILITHIIPVLHEMQESELREISIKALQIQYRGNLIDDYEGTEKAIYRLYIIGIVEDYTIDFKNPRTYSLQIRRRPRLDYSNALYDYLILRMDKQIFENIYHSNSKVSFYDFICQYNDNYVQGLLEVLITFVYTTIEPQRRRAIQSMADAARTLNSEEFRNKILRYLSPDEELNILFKIFPQSSRLEEWQIILSKNVNTSANNKLLGICLRNLESYPTSVGLLFLASTLRLSLLNENENMGIKDFSAGIRLVKENYPQEEALRITRYFAEYVLNKGQYEVAKYMIANTFLENFPSIESAEWLYYGNFTINIREVGAAYLGWQIQQRLERLILKIKE
nr:hypothetical protein [FCB group bacterium]